MLFSTIGMLGEEASLAHIQDYVISVNELAQVSDSERKENEKRNSHLLIEEKWEVFRLIEEFKKKMVSSRWMERPKGPLSHKRG